MKKQSIHFAVKSRDGIIEKVGKAIIFQKKLNFGGGSVKWHENEPKKNDAGK